jgi:two-component system chemotaxis response regulator CheB
MIRLLITEDSPSIAEVLKAILKVVDDIEIVGWARNGKESIKLTERLKPDVILMDITMPIMDGLEATRVIMNKMPTPILILSSLIKDDSSISFEALRAGALDIMEKPALQLISSDQHYEEELIRKIKIVSNVHPIHLINSHEKGCLNNRSVKVPRENRILAIGASTGGPPAICNILKKFVPGFPLPILVVQHICNGFTQGLVSWLRRNCSIKIKLAENGETVSEGVAYFAADDFHLGVDMYHRIILSKEKPIGGHRPSVDFMMEHVASSYKEGSIAIILTGMGNDGTEGLRAVKKQGGKIIVQDEKSSIVFGMPKSAIDAGLADKVCPLKKIPAEILKLLSVQ